MSLELKIAALCVAVVVGLVLCVWVLLTDDSGGKHRRSGR